VFKIWGSGLRKMGKASKEKKKKGFF